MTDHEELERLAKIAESMRDSCPDRPEETIGDNTIVPLAYSQRADFAAIARLLREPVNARLLRQVQALKSFYPPYGQVTAWKLIDDVLEMFGKAAAESAPREMPAWVTRGTFDEMAAEAKRLTARVQWLEAECVRWKFDADTTREAHICTHRRAEKLEAELARLRAAPRVGVESVVGRIRSHGGQGGEIHIDVVESLLRECWPAAGKGE